MPQECEAPRGNRARGVRQDTKAGQGQLAYKVLQELTVAQVQRVQWVPWVCRVPGVTSDPTVHLDLREALDSLGSKVNWEMLVFLGTKERADPKENLVPLVPKE